MTDAQTICHDLDLLGDWLDAKGYTEEAGLCTLAMDEIARLRDEIERLQKYYVTLMTNADDLRAARAAMGESDE